MNIHKSAMITVLLGCVFATQAYAQFCSQLRVRVSKDIMNDYTVLKDQFVYNHGSYNDTQPFAGYTDYIFQQGPWYGPDIILPFTRKTDGQIVKIRVQQNYCVFEAGSITVEPIRGKWVYRAREGSFWNNLKGNVWLDQVSLNN